MPINSASFSFKCLAFTLAEVLITIGVIGVVAAITIPTLVQKYRNKVVETRLEKFYTNINQAISRAEIDYGDRSLWFGENIKNETEKKEWFKKYIIPYMQVVKMEKYNSTSRIALWFPDGSVLLSGYNSEHFSDFTFVTGNPDKCFVYGKCAFLFYYNPNHTTYPTRNIEPYKYGLTTITIDKLKNDNTYGCYNSSTYNHYCTALIQLNGWKIPDDYPWKVMY